ncbi:MAG: FkbM family methyltransferase [Tannerella sp.]|jgi:FkbM family methyltransferase|nr:FkbM family methyltransferase [Tannerella sp.]
MDFNELLKPADAANDIAVIESLQESDLPVVLYGATVDVADQIVKKLAANNIKIKMVVFDEESPVMTDSTVLLKEIEKVRTEYLDQKMPGYHVVLGFVKAYGHIDKIPAKFKNARSVSYLSEIFDMEIITPSFVQENKVFLKDLYDNLQDQHSKDSLVAYLLSKTRQDMKYLPPIFDKIQYFPQGMFQFTDHESYFDCGAFTGDTIAEFLKASGGSYRHIWAAEPDRSNYKQLIQYIEDEKLSDIDVVNKGIYSYAGKLPFQEDGSMLSMISEESDRYIEVDTIDNITAGNPVTYIKMDVEGVELMALKGAEQTIRKYKPVLGISIYHKERDLIDIPMYIKEIVPEYKFYFRVHKKLAIDTVLYGVVR